LSWIPQERSWIHLRFFKYIHL